MPGRLKVWVPDNDPGSARAFGAFGIAPIPLPIADVLGGLQTGLIDSVATPPVAAIALQWHTQLDHVMDLPMVYVYGLLAVADRGLSAGLPKPTGRWCSGSWAAWWRAVNARSRSDHEAGVRRAEKPGAGLARDRAGGAGGMAAPRGCRIAPHGGRRLHLVGPLPGDAVSPGGLPGSGPVVREAPNPCPAPADSARCTRQVRLGGPAEIYWPD